jgi:hypothetical protein
MGNVQARRPKILRLALTQDFNAVSNQPRESSRGRDPIFQFDAGNSPASHQLSKKRMLVPPIPKRTVTVMCPYSRGHVLELGDCLNTFEQADLVLQALYEAPVGASGALFRDELGKQWMQSCIIRAVRKLKAAEYHCANIDAEIQRLRELAEQSAQTTGMTRGGMFVFGEKEKVAYEVDAFLAAARGCIDFIAGMLSLHLRGMSRRTSITSLLERAERESAASFSILLTRWKEWIELVKEYRDECIHYRTIEATGGFRVDVKDGERILTIIPVLVPEHVLPDKPTSGNPAAGRFLIEIHQLVGIAGVPPHAEGPLSESAKKIIEMMEPIHEGNGYIRAELFCQQHLERLHLFVSESFEEVLTLKFQSYAG